MANERFNEEAAPGTYRPSYLLELLAQVLGSLDAGEYHMAEQLTREAQREAQNMGDAISYELARREVGHG